MVTIKQLHLLKEKKDHDPWRRDGSWEVFTLRCVRVSVDLCGRQTPYSLPESRVPVERVERQKATSSAYENRAAKTNESEE
jgi:hypothetical protein